MEKRYGLMNSVMTPALQKQCGFGEEKCGYTRPRSSCSLPAQTELTDGLVELGVMSLFVFAKETSQKTSKNNEGLTRRSYLDICTQTVPKSHVSTTQLRSLMFDNYMKQTSDIFSNSAIV